MASTIVRITDPKPSVKLYQTDRPGRMARWGVGNLGKYLWAIASGVRKATVTSVVDGTTLATASAEVNAGSADGTCTINGVALAGNGADAAARAVALAAAVNESTDALVKGLVTAAVTASGKVTVSAFQPGKLGNAVTVAVSGTGWSITGGGARLAGGAGDDSTATSYNLL